MCSRVHCACCGNIKRHAHGLGRSRPPSGDAPSVLPETRGVGQGGEGNAMDGNYNVILHLYQLLPAGFI